MELLGSFSAEFSFTISPTRDDVEKFLYKHHTLPCDSLKGVILYRNAFTKYCPKLSDLKEKKEKVKEAVLQEHPRAKDIHTYISDNRSCYKQQFVAAYNGKCPYCGVTLAIIGWKQFEIDHFIPKDSSRFSSKAQAGSIENLVLACYDCNRSKSSLELSEEDLYKVDPDGPDICNTFTQGRYLNTVFL